MIPVQKLAPILFGLAVAAAHAPCALAQPAESIPEEDLARARDLFREGSKLAEAGDWEGARDRFERSLKIKHAAITLYNLGIAQQETAHLAAATESFKAFLAQPVEPATEQYVEPVRAALKQLEGRIPRIGVTVQPANVPGVVVKIDGRDVAAGEGARPVDPGRHEVSAVAPGFGALRQTVWMLEGTRTDLAVTLTPTPPPPPPSIAAAVGGGIAVGIGARHGTSGPIDGKAVVAGAAVEGAGALAIGAGFLVLLSRVSPKAQKAQKAAVAPWAAGSVGGVRVRF
jgi:hypothetical protein